MRLIRFAVLTGVLGGLVSAEVFAQEDTGPVRLSVGVAAYMTDNRDAQENNKQSNTDVYLRPRVDIFLDRGSSLFTLYYEPGLRYRTEPGDNQDETSLQHNLGVQVRHSLSERTRIRFRDHLTVTDDPSVEDNGNVVRGDQSYLMNKVELGLGYDLFQFSNIDFLAMNRILRFDEKAVGSLSDEDEMSFKVQHRRSLNSTLRTLLTGEYRIYQYEKTALYSRDFNSFIAAVGLENSFTPNTIGSVSVGWQTREYDASEIDSDGNPYFNAELSGLLNPDLRVGAVIGYGLRDSDAYPYPSQEYTDFRGFADAKLTQKLALRLAGTYRISKYDDYGMRAGGDEDTLVGDIELTFKISDLASVMIGYRVEDISADESVGSSYVKNTSRVGATLSF